MNRNDTANLLRLARQVLETEAAAITALVPRLDEHFSEACRLLLACRGRVVVMGMGKSGHVGNKIAATLASTGTPAFYVHPGEASHGDMGMITGEDVVLALSNSGETGELIIILPLIKRLGVKLVALTGQSNSTLAKAADVNLDVSVAQEACPLNLAPTASTTAALAMGDALAVSLLSTRGFTEEDFARSHPGGSLGRRLLLRVQDIMHTGETVPAVAEGALLSQALEKEVNVHRTKIDEVMTRRCTTVAPETLAGEALHLMESHRFNALLVVAPSGVLVGALNMHDLLRAGV